MAENRSTLNIHKNAHVRICEVSYTYAAYLIDRCARVQDDLQVESWYRDIDNLYWSGASRNVNDDGVCEKAQLGVPIWRASARRLKWSVLRCVLSLDREGVYQGEQQPALRRSGRSGLHLKLSQ